MANIITDYKTQQILFEQFCTVRNWNFIKFSFNPKNSTQYVGQCVNGDGEKVTILITEKGDYFQLLGDKKFKPIEYVLKDEEDA